MPLWISDGRGAVCWVLPLASVRVEHCGQWIAPEQWYAVSSRATSTLPSPVRCVYKAPCSRKGSTSSKNSGARCSGEIASARAGGEHRPGMTPMTRRGNSCASSQQLSACDCGDLLDGCDLDTPGIVVDSER